MLQKYALLFCLQWVLSIGCLAVHSSGPPKSEFSFLTCRLRKRDFNQHQIYPRRNSQPNQKFVNRVSTPTFSLLTARYSIPFFLSPSSFRICPPLVPFAHARPAPPPHFRRAQGGLPLTWALVHGAPGGLRGGGGVFVAGIVCMYMCT